MTEAGLQINSVAIEERFAAGAMRGGKEHLVAFLADESRVLKVADVHALATETLYDYLTDLLLSNYYFDDDIQMLGGYQSDGRLQFVISQPYVDGQHPTWPKLKTGLVKQGLRDPKPRSLGGTFIIDDEVLGEVDVYDLHVNNVICDSSGWLHPIDAHFYFDDRTARVKALHALALNRVSGPTPLAVSGMPRTKRT